VKKTRWVAARLVAAALLLLLSFSPSGHASQIQTDALQDNQSPTNASVPEFEDGDNTPEAQSRLYPVQVNGKWGYIHLSGALVVIPQFEAPEPFVEGLGVVTGTAP